jgi:hypothetical protein
VAVACVLTSADAGGPQEKAEAAAAETVRSQAAALGEARSSESAEAREQAVRAVRPGEGEIAAGLPRIHLLRIGTAAARRRALGARHEMG